MVFDSEAEEWKAKARRAEEQAANASNKQDAATWSETARIYRELAARRQAWADAWKPRTPGTHSGKGPKSDAT